MQSDRTGLAPTNNKNYKRYTLNTSKFWLRSKTILFHLMLTLGGAWASIEASFGNLKESMTPQQFGLVMMGVGIVGVLLRAVTSTPVTTKLK